jgi:hypothetical protein
MARNDKPAWSTQPFVRTVHNIEHCDVVNCGIFAHQFPDTRPWEWTKQVVKTLEEDMESYIVEVIAEYSFLQQQLM